MKRMLTVALLCVVVFSVLAQDVWSQTLTTQGVLRDSNGRAVEDGDYTLTFRLYEAEKDGSSLWEEVHQDVSIVNGVYSVVLGSQNSLSNIDFSNQPYWLAVKVETGQEMEPRIRFSMSPYLYNVEGAENVFPSSGRVGIGTKNPEVKLDVKGTIQLQKRYGPGDLGDKIQWGSGTAIGPYIASVRTGGNDPDVQGLAFYTHPSATADDAPVERMRIRGNGRVGIGTDNPTAKLDVIGDETRLGGLRFTESNGINYIQSGADRVQNSWGPLHFGRYLSGTTYLAISNDGQVGIGTDNPTAKLDVNGAMNVNGGINVYGQTPFRFVRFDNIGTGWIDYDTNFQTATWSAAIIGFDMGSGDINESGTGNLGRMRMVKDGNHWHIHCGFRTHVNDADWSVDVMFIRKELVTEVDY